MARMSRAMRKLLTDLSLKVFDSMAQLHPSNTLGERILLERRMKKNLKSIAEYLAVIHEDEEEKKDASSEAE